MIASDDDWDGARAGNGCDDPADAVDAVVDVPRMTSTSPMSTTPSTANASMPVSRCGLRPSASR